MKQIAIEKKQKVTDERNKKKRVLQKLMKEKGFILSYSTSHHECKLYLQKEKNKQFITFEYVFFANPLPKLVINLSPDKSTNKNKLTENILIPIELIIKEFLSQLEVLEVDMYEIEISGGIYFSRDHLKIIRNYLKEKWFIHGHRENRHPMKFLSHEAYFMSSQVVEVVENIEKERQESFFNKTETKQKIPQIEERFPHNFSFKYKDVIDANVNVDINFFEKVFDMKISSVYHKKVIKLDAINKEIIEKEFNIFKDEEKFKALVEGPVMNETIHNQLERMIEHMYFNRLKPKKLFEYLIEHIEIEEMNRLSETYRYRKFERKTETTFMHREETGNYREKYFRIASYIYSFWNKFINVIEVREEGQESESYYFYLDDELENVKKNEKNWLVGYLTK